MKALVLALLLMVAAAARPAEMSYTNDLPPVTTFFVCTNPDILMSAWQMPDEAQSHMIMEFAIHSGECHWLGGPRLVRPDEPVVSWFREPYLFTVWRTHIEGEDYFIMNGVVAERL
jgi:hypothetical protein